MDLHTLLAAANFIEYENKEMDKAIKANISESVGATAHIKSDKSNNYDSNLDKTTYLAERHMLAERHNHQSLSKNQGRPEFQVSSHGIRSGFGDTPSRQQQDSESNAYPTTYSSPSTATVANPESLPAQQHVGHVTTSESSASYDDYPDSPKPLQIVDVTAPSMDVLVARARMAIVSTTVDSDQTRNSASPVNRYTPTKDSAQSDATQSMINELARKSPQSVGRRVRETGPHSTPVTPLTPTGKKENGQNVNTLLPSLIQTSEDEKVYAALQFKQMKRNVTLTHNQLEKNRRAHLKERFEALKSCIPRLGMRRSSNLTILKAALRHIETLKKKASDHQQALEALKREKQEKIDRLVALKNELLEQASSKIIDSYLEESLSNGGGDCATEDTASIASVQTAGELEDDQQSTSTASEAEEEEIKAAANRGRAHQFRSPDFSRDIVIYPPPALTNRPQPPPAAAMRPSSNPVITQSPVVLAQSKHQQQFQHDKPQPPPYTEAKRVYVNGSQKSPVKLYGTPTGRSATPSPPSNCVSFFPRFNIGSGGSPPLHSSNEMLRGAKPPPPTVFASQKFGPVRKSLEPQAAAASAAAGVLNPVYQVLSSYAIAQPGVAAKPMVNTKTESVGVNPTKLLPATDIDEVSQGKQAATPTSRPTTSSTTVVVGADGRVVSLPTFSGYQVKVKYVTPSIMVTSQSATSGSGSTSTSQAHIPMKKRHYDVSTFATPSNKPKAKALSDSVPKMTSLYVGASAAVLGLSNSESGLSTSDTESERDSPMFPEHARTGAKLRHHHQWRRSTAKEWTEYRGRGPEAAKRNNFISYDPPKASPSNSAAPSSSLSSAQHPKQSADSRPKATFSLWDRKHHAITMTTATNWRGKQQQQMLTSQSKSSPTPAPMSNPTSQQPTATQVCYTTLREPSKPTVPTTLVVGSQSSQSPQAVATAPQLATSSPYAFVANVTAPQPAKMHQSQVEIGTVSQPAALSRTSAAPLQLAQLTAPRNNVTTRTHFVQSAAKVNVSAASATFPSMPGNFPQGQAALQAVPVSLPSNHVAYQIVPPNFMTQGIVSRSGLTQHAAAPAVNAPVGYLLPAPVQPQQEQKVPLLSHPGGERVTTANIVAAPAGNMPFMIPVGYVMYPGNMPVAQPGVQLASIQPPSAKVLAAAQSELVPVSCAQIVYQSMPSGAVKRSATPVLVGERGRTRVGSADSAGSSTISADSIDAEKRDAPKRQRLSPKDQPTPPAAPSLPPGQLLAPTHGGAQLMFPGNPRFVVANNGAAIPINLLGYPFASHHYESGSMQTVRMASAAQGASGQVWSINQGMGFQLAPAAVPTQQSMTSPVTLQLMPAAQPEKTS